MCCLIIQEDLIRLLPQIHGIRLMKRTDMCIYAARTVLKQLMHIFISSIHLQIIMLVLTALFRMEKKLKV